MRYELGITKKAFLCIIIMLTGFPALDKLFSVLFTNTNVCFANLSTKIDCVIEYILNERLLNYWEMYLLGLTQYKEK